MYGLDLLGLPKFAELARKEFPQGWALGTFARTFGDALPHVRAILDTGRCAVVRVQLVWSDSHQFGVAETAAAIKEARRYEKLAREFPNIKIELSPFCEHNIKSPDSELSKVQDRAPSCTVVNTPWTGGLSAKFKNEVHGTKAKALKGKYNFSYDGSSSVDSDVETVKATHTAADCFYFWVPQFNGRKSTNDTTPRPDRKAYPVGLSGSRLIDSVIYLSRARGDSRLAKGFLWKSHAEQHDSPIPEPRAFKPVLICPVKAKKFDLITDNGQSVATLPYYGTYSGGGYRYYAQDFGYLIQEKAFRIQGRGSCKLVAEGKDYGTVAAAFRLGGFRD